MTRAPEHTCRRLQLNDAAGRPVAEVRVAKASRVVIAGERVFVQHDVQNDPQRALSYLEVDPVRVELPA